MNHHSAIALSYIIYIYYQEILFEFRCIKTIRHKLELQ